VRFTLALAIVISTNEPAAGISAAAEVLQLQYLNIGSFDRHNSKEQEESSSGCHYQSREINDNFFGR
jgi:hypothetical protein